MGSAATERRFERMVLQRGNHCGTDRQDRESLATSADIGEGSSNAGKRSCGTTPKRSSPVTSVLWLQPPSNWSTCSSSLKSQADVSFTLMSHNIPPRNGRCSNFGSASRAMKDIDTSFTTGTASIQSDLDAALKSMGLTVLRTPYKSPQANAVCERFIGTARRECLDYMIP